MRIFQGRNTANGEVYNMNEMTAAHKSLPFNTFIPANIPTQFSGANSISSKLSVASDAGYQKIEHDLRNINSKNKYALKSIRVSFARRARSRAIAFECVLSACD